MASVAKFLIVLCCVGTIGVGGFAGWRMWSALRSAPPLRMIASTPPTTAAPTAPAAHGAASDHGGASGAHGAPASGASHHGAAAGEDPLASHGPLSETGTYFTLDEVYVNVMGDHRDSHSIGMKLELELFGEDVKTVLEQRKGGVVHTILQTTREQQYESLNNLSGKLEYKELLVQRVNEFLKKAVVRDIHFVTFHMN